MSLPVSYGISLTDPSWVCNLITSRPHLQLMTYMENRWGTQDVVGCVRVDRVEESASPVQVPFGRIG
jgi:hypothetical protein